MNFNHLARLLANRSLHRNAAFRAAGLGILFCFALFAQQPETFEVISIKPHPEPIDFTQDSIEGGNYHAVGLTLLALIEDAYAVGRFQVSGGPGWLTSAHFDVEAKTGDSSPLTWERVRPMLQAALADRFRLKLERAPKDIPCYELVIAPGGLKLRENTDPGPAGGVSFGTDAIGAHLRAESGTMSRLARNLAVPAGRLIVDKTNLAGKYRITLDYAPDDSPEEVRASRPTLLSALQEQLGLRLVPSRMREDVLTIQSAEKPSGN